MEKTYVKARGYETAKQHWGIENDSDGLINSDRYQNDTLSPIGWI
ncbi:MAG: hypothetical protein V7K46_00445 [Nostoc sp.]